MKNMIRLLCLLSIFAFCDQAMAATFDTGNTLIIGWREHQKVMSGQSGNIMQASSFVSYVIGVSDALDGVSFDIPDKATKDQVCSVVGRYLDLHTEPWTNTGSVIVIAALKAVFPRK